MADDILKQFMVAIGYREDEASKRRFMEGLKKAEVAVAGLAAGLTAMATAAATAALKVAGAFEGLSYASQKAGATVQNLKGLSYAVSQLGGSYQGALQSVEAFAKQMRTNPGYEGLVRSLGVATRQNGKLRETTDILADLGKVFARQPYYTGYHYAQTLGIDEDTFRAIRDHGDQLKQFKEEYDRTARSLGVNQDDMGRRSADLMSSWRRLTSTLDVLSAKVAETFYPALKKALDYLSETIVKYGPQINAFWTQVGNGIEVVERGFRAAYNAVEPFVTALTETLVGGFNKSGGSRQLLTELKQLFTDISTVIKRAYDYLVKFVQLIGLDKVAAALGASIKGGFRAEDWNGGGMPDWTSPVPEAGATGKGALEPYRKGRIARAFGAAKDFITGNRTPSIRHGYQTGQQGSVSLGKIGRSENARAIIDELRAAGYSDNAVAAVVGSMQTESGFNPRAANDVTGGHTGLWQWDKSRWPKIRDWIKARNGDPYDVRWQTKAWVAEHDAKPGDPMYDHRRTAAGGAILRNNPSLEDAIHGVRESERFGVGEEGGRAAHARRWLPNLDSVGRQPAPRPVGQATNVSDAQVIANDHGHYARLNRALGGMDFTARHGATDAPLGVTNNMTNSNDRSLNMPLSVTMNVQGTGSPQETADAAMRGLTRFQDMSLRNAQSAIR